MMSSNIADSSQIAGDQIVVGDISRSYAAIGRGAQVIVNEAISHAHELDEYQQLAERRLAAAIRHKAERYALVANSTAAEQEGARFNPYRALLSYRVEDAHLFFGRDKVIATLLGRLQSSPLVVLHAESGAGKTSLLGAGLASRLLVGSALPLLVRARNRTPALAIKKDLLPNIETDPALAPLVVSNLHGFLTLVCQNLGTHRLYIILDQFEEFFIRLNRPEQEHFAEELGECVADSSLNVRWIFALRKEYFSDMEKLRPHIANPFACHERLEPFSPEEAFTIITAPAAAYGVQYDDGLPELIIANLAEQARGTDSFIIPPQLQIVCFSLFSELGGNETAITMRHYQSKRCAAGLLGDHLKNVLNNNLDESMRPKAIRLLELLVDSKGQRAARSVNSLQYALADDCSARDVDRILTELRENRLVRFLDEGESGYYYELAHDYLSAEIHQSPESRARKAATEILERELENWKQARALMRPETLRIVAAQRGELRFSPDETDLLLRSAFVHNQDIAGWLSVAPKETARQALIDRSNDEDEKMRIRAIQNLGPYLDQSVISHLTTMASSDPASQVRAHALQLLLAVAPATAYGLLRSTPFARQAEIYAALGKAGIRLPRLLRWQMAPARLVAYLQKQWKERPVWLLVRILLLILAYGAFAWWQGLPPFVRWDPVPSVPREEIGRLARSPSRLYVGSNNHGIGYVDIANNYAWVGWMSETLPVDEQAKFNDPASNVLPISELVVNQSRPEQLYIYIHEYGLMRSDNGGQQWQNLAGLASLVPTTAPTLTVSLAAWDRYVLLATTSDGLYGSHDYGDHWARLDDGVNLPIAPYAMAQFDHDGRPYVSTERKLYGAEAVYPWVWDKLQDVAVRYMEFTPDSKRAFLSIGYPIATMVTCFEQDKGLGQLVNFYDKIITGIAPDPTDNALFYVSFAFGAETQSVTCSGDRRGLGQQPLLSIVYDLQMIAEDGYLYQATSSGLYRRQP